MTACIRLLSTARMFVALICVCRMLCACDSRELCYDHTHWLDLRVDFDWSGEPDADPRTMVVWLFPKTGDDEPRRYEFADINGGTTIRVPAGEYNAVAFNGDTETLLEVGSTYGNFVITTGEQDLLAPMNRSNISNAPRPQGTETQPVRMAPDKMWSAKLENISIKPMVSGQSIGFKPSLSTITIRFRLINVENLNYDVDVSAAISSVCESYHIGNGRPAGQDVTHPVSLEPVDPTTYVGQVSVFGHCADGFASDNKKHILTIYTSNKYYYNYDVTSQIHDASDPGNVVIIIDGLKLPDPSRPGVSPEVSGWSDVIDEDINM